MTPDHLHDLRNILVLDRELKLSSLGQILFRIEIFHLQKGYCSVFILRPIFGGNSFLRGSGFRLFTRSDRALIFGLFFAFGNCFFLDQGSRIGLYPLVLITSKKIIKFSRFSILLLFLATSSPHSGFLSEISANCGKILFAIFVNFANKCQLGVSYGHDLGLTLQNSH